MTDALKKAVFTVLAVFAVVVSPFATGPVAAATTSFNQDPKDKPTLRVTNYTRNSECSTCWSYETAASVGDTVSFDVYYHNTGDATAQGTNVSVDLNPSGSYIGATGSVDASNSAAATGNANVNVNMSGYTNLRARFLSASWYPDQTTSPQSIAANGPSVSIGNIDTGWEHQGHVVFRFKLEADSTSGGGDNPNPGGNQLVYGFHDGYAGAQSGETCAAFGWAADPDSPDSPVTVKIYVDGQFRDMSYQITANQYRGDVKAANKAGCPSGNCGFHKQLNLEPGPHNITVYAIDKQTNAVTRLATTDKAIECSTPPPDTCPAGSSPTVSTGGTVSVGSTSARVSGSVDGKGKAATYWVEYGTSQSSLSSRTSTRSGSGNVEVSISGLQSNRTYYYRFVVQTECGTANGEVRSFHTDDGYNPPRPPQCTDPSATTGSYSNLTSNSVTLAASFSSNASTKLIQYRQQGTSTWLTAGSGTSVGVSGLTPDTTYEYRAFAQNSCDTATGAVMTFKTLPGGGECTAPTATTGSYSNLTNTSVTLAASFSSNATTQLIQYRQQGNSTWLTAGNGTSVNLGNLSPSTTYEYRAFAQNACNTGSGTVQTFTTTGNQQCTLPSASTGSYSVLNDTAVRITGTTTGNISSVRMEYRRQYDNYWQTAGTGSSVEIYGLSRGVTYEYRIVATNECGTATGNTQTFRLSDYQQGNPPEAETRYPSNITQYSATLNGDVNPRGSYTDAWFEWGTSRYMVENGGGYTIGQTNAGSDNSFRAVFAYLSGLTTGTTYYYRVVARNSYGTDRGQVVEFRTDGGQSYLLPPTAITNPATNIGRESALLNGRVNPNGSQTSGWFEWGTNFSNVANGGGIRTTSYPVGSGNFLLDISHALGAAELSPNTTYYFRAGASNSAGTSYGQVLSFRTLAPATTGGGGGGTIVVTRPAPIVVTTLTGVSGSCLTLTPSINGELLPGGEFVYGITYRNDCPFDLQNTTLRNIIPNEVDFGSTNYPFLTRDLNVITYSLGTVPRNFQATILVRGLIKPVVRIGDTLIFKSDLSFTDPQGRFQTVSATLPAAVGANSLGAAQTGQVLGASIFDTLAGLFTSGWFWFLLFLLLLALFILWLATRNRGEDHDHE